MPCRDYYDDHPEQYYRDVTEPGLKAQVSFAESALCQTLAAFDRVLYDVANRLPGELQSINCLDFINYDEAGIKRIDLEKWWTQHKALDAQHRKEEQERKARAAALAKLTKAEKKLLGLA